jgi:hypothetical protein
VEVRAPRHGRLCLKCLGEAITTSSSSMFGRLVELNAMVRDLVKQPVAPAPAPAPAWKPIS